MRRVFFSFVSVLIALTAVAAPRRVALIVQNHCSGNVQPPMSALADTLAASLTADGLSVVIPANSIGTMQNTSAAGESMPKASAKELGSILGVDGILTASVQEFTSESITPFSKSLMLYKCSSTSKVSSKLYFAEFQPIPSVNHTK